MGGYPRIDANEDSAREIARLLVAVKGGGTEVPMHGTEYHLSPLGDHDWLELVTSTQHHTHYHSGVVGFQSKICTGGETVWSLPVAPLHGVAFYRNGLRQSYNMFAVTENQISVGEAAVEGEIWDADFEGEAT